MGIIRSNAVFYLEARNRGVDFTRIVTLGRQRLYLTPPDLRAVTRRYQPDAGPSQGLPYGDPADAFFERFLGAVEVSAIDRSSYEGATIDHDLNQPLPSEWHERFDVVIDSGTLEHIFNLPTAVASCMQLVKRGGTLFLASPANNLCGHGFYQFSPELFFRLFKDANGFTLTRMVLVTHPFPGAELSSRQVWYEVADPADIGMRVPFMTPTPAFLMIEARRAEIVPVLTDVPQQSDYVTRWAQSQDPTHRRHLRASAAGSLARQVFRRLPPRLQALTTGCYQRGVLCTLRNRRAFRRIKR